MTAVDAAVQSKLLGALTVTLAYRGPRERMKASAAASAPAEADMIVFSGSSQTAAAKNPASAAPRPGASLRSTEKSAIASSPTPCTQVSLA